MGGVDQDHRARMSLGDSLSFGDGSHRDVDYVVAVLIVAGIAWWLVRYLRTRRDAQQTTQV